MRFVSASVERIPIPAPTDRTTVYKHLEKIGRLCYKSEDKITDVSCEKFINNLHSRKHWAMLEHYPFVITDDNSSLYQALRCMYDAGPAYVQGKLPYIKQNLVDIPTRGGITTMVSGSATAFNYLLEAVLQWVEEDKSEDNFQGEVIPFMKDYFDFMDYMHCRFPLLFNKPYPDKHMSSEEFDKLDENYRLWSQDELMEIEDPAVNMHLYMTVKFITDRGVTHEIVRHRPSSYAQESTRYCNYGKSGCVFIIPEWFNDIEKGYLTDIEPEKLREDIVTDNKPKDFREGAWKLVKTMYILDTQYTELVDPNTHKWSPQQARYVLPNGVKTEIIMTTNLPEWDHFFHMRVPKTAHPQMREVSIPLYHTARDVYDDRLTNFDKEAEE